MHSSKFVDINRSSKDKRNLIKQQIKFIH